MTDQLPPPQPPEPTSRTTGRIAGRSTGRRLLVAGVGAGLLAGGAIGFAAGVPNLTSAATPAVVDEPVETTTDTDTETDTSTDDSEVGRQATGERLRERLQPLVDDGTIDAMQADAVSTFLADEWNDRPGRHGGPGHRAHPLIESVDTAVEILGIDAETLRDELRSGSSLAEIAEANGVDPQTLIDALVAEAEAMLDQAVADGRIDADRAEERRTDLDERITALVNGERPERPAHAETDTHAGAESETDTDIG